MWMSKSCAEKRSSTLLFLPGCEGTGVSESKLASGVPSRALARELELCVCVSECVSVCVWCVCVWAYMHTGGKQSVDGKGKGGRENWKGEKRELHVRTCIHIIRFLFYVIHTVTILREHIPWGRIPTTTHTHTHKHTHTHYLAVGSGSGWAKNLRCSFPLQINKLPGSL